VNLVITSDGKYLYAPLIPSGIAAFAVNRSTGALSNVAGSPFATTNQPFSLAIGAGGRFMYSIGGSSSNEIEAFTIDGSNGSLTALAGSPFAMPSQLGSLTVDGSGKFLYATVWASTLSESAILGFAIDPSTGSLTPLTGSPYSSAPFPVDAVTLNIP
jgi:6-phosphogluconolactonase (cycloisomerase 2 family)